MHSKLRIALAQISSEAGNKKKNLEIMRKNVVRAKRESAQLIIFPELSLTGYVVRDQIYELAERIPGPSTRVVEKLSKDYELHIIFGMPEICEDTQATLYNCAVLVGPHGLIGKYHKMYLPTHSVFEEKRYFRPGYQVAVYNTELGKIGLVVCYDIYFPEITRLARLKGAQLIVCISASPGIRRTFFETLTAARAIENTVFLAYVNRAGIEDGLQFWGGSRLIGPGGNTIVEAKYDEEDFVIAELDYADARSVETFLPTLRDLRPELFEKLRQCAEDL